MYVFVGAKQRTIFGVKYGNSKIDGVPVRTRNVLWPFGDRKKLIVVPLKRTMNDRANAAKFV